MHVKNALPSEARMAALLEPFLGVPGEPEPVGGLLDRLVPPLHAYLEILTRWNARTNLTSVRDPEQIVTRHFGESLFAGRCLAAHAVLSGELLDLGSGAGLPGLPIQLLYPELRVTLAESQGKKVAFLREVVRSLGLQTEVWPRRVEEMEPGRRFGAVTLRAVDKMSAAVALGRSRVAAGGWLVQLRGEPDDEVAQSSKRIPGASSRFVTFERIEPVFHVEHA